MKSLFNTDEILLLFSRIKVPSVNEWSVMSPYKYKKPLFFLLSLEYSHSPATSLLCTITFYLLSICYSASVPTLTNTEGGRLPFERRPFNFVRTGQSNPPGLRATGRHCMSLPASVSRPRSFLLLQGPVLIWLNFSEERNKPLKFSRLCMKAPPVHSTNVSVKYMWQILRKTTQ